MQSIGLPHKLITFLSTSVGTIKTLPCKTNAQYAAFVIDIPEATQTPVLDQYWDSMYKLPVSFQRKSLLTSTVRRPVKSERTILHPLYRFLNLNQNLIGHSPKSFNPFMSTIITIGFIFLTGFYSVCVITKTLWTLVFEHVGV
jgi:hypothetical protein